MNLRTITTGNINLAGSVSSRFKYLNAMFYNGQPDLAPYGFEKVDVLYHNELIPDNTNVRTQAQVNDILAQYTTTNHIILDIEHPDWGIWTNQTEVQDEANLWKYEETLRKFKVGNPNGSYGFYGVPPYADKSKALSLEGSAERDAWDTGNNRLFGFAGAADVLYPNLYSTSVGNISEWVTMAKRFLRESYRLANGKPVYPFIWPQYNIGPDYDPVPTADWRTMLETVWIHADGAVFWGGGTLVDWDDNAAWWLETLDFIEERNGTDY